MRCRTVPLGLLPRSTFNGGGGRGGAGPAGSVGSDILASAAFEDANAPLCDRFRRRRDGYPELPLLDGVLGPFSVRSVDNAGDVNARARGGSTGEDDESPDEV